MLQSRFQTLLQYFYCSESQKIQKPLWTESRFASGVSQATLRGAGELLTKSSAGSESGFSSLRILELVAPPSSLLQAHPLQELPKASRTGWFLASMMIGLSRRSGSSVLGWPGRSDAAAVHQSIVLCSSSSFRLPARMLPVRSSSSILWLLRRAGGRCWRRCSPTR